MVSAQQLVDGDSSLSLSIHDVEESLGFFVRNAHQLQLLVHRWHLDQLLESHHASSRHGHRWSAGILGLKSLAGLMHGMQKLRLYRTIQLTISYSEQI